jgi:hypothetical protein
MAGLAFVDGEFQDYDMHGSNGAVWLAKMSWCV